MDTSTISLIISIGGIVASVASAIAIVKTKIAHLEGVIEEFESETKTLREVYSKTIAGMDVRIALLEKTQQTHEKELTEMKLDIKSIMTTVNEISVTIKTALKKKGGE